MLAGHETTANALAWTWYLLALNPDARDRMLAEIDSVLGGRRPTLDDLPQLPWTTACFQEGDADLPARLGDPAQGGPRRRHRRPPDPQGRDGVHPDLRASTTTRASGPTPRPSTRPASWRRTRKARHRSAYLPFGGGRRVCIGTSFALMEGDADPRDDEPALQSTSSSPATRSTPEATLTLRPRDGLRMIAHRRAPAPRRWRHERQARRRARASITGAGSGIGEATALRFAEAGRAGRSAVDIDGDAAAATAEACAAGRRRGGQPYVCDVADAAAVRLALAVERAGRSRRARQQRRRRDRRAVPRVRARGLGVAARRSTSTASSHGCHAFGSGDGRARARARRQRRVGRRATSRTATWPPTAPRSPR